MAGRPQEALEELRDWIFEWGHQQREEERRRRAAAEARDREQIRLKRERAESETRAKEQAERAQQAERAKAEVRRAWEMRRDMWANQQYDRQLFKRKTVEQFQAVYGQVVEAPPQAEVKA